MGELDPGALANEYLELAKRIDECENRQDLIKDNLRGILSPFDAVSETPPGVDIWPCTGAVGEGTYHREGGCEEAAEGAGAGGC